MYGGAPMDLSNIENLYHELGKLIEGYHKTNVSPFIIHFGKKFPEHPNEGILFVGRATNGNSNGSSIGNNYEHQLRIALEPQNYNNIKWIEEQFSQKNSYCRKSAFWRVVRSISKEFYGDNWYEKIGWSDLYKIAPSKRGKTNANPDIELMKLQKDKCVEILEAEIQMLSPKYVVLFVGNWVSDFLFRLNHGTSKSIATYEWGIRKPYKTKLYNIDNRYFILTEHPQGKNETELINCILNIMKSI